jgi:hypothetical protein
VGNGDPNADEYMEKMLPTKVGRGLFPLTSAHIGVKDHLLTLGQNCATLLERSGKHLRQALGFFLVGGLPPSFMAETLNTTSREINNFQKQPVQTAIYTLNWNYAPDPNRKSFNVQEENVMEDFFFQTTSVMSGAVRETRNLEKTEHEWEEEMYALWPQMLRKAVLLDPELLTATKKLTVEEQEAGTPHGMAVLCVAVHTIMGPSSVYIAWSHHQQITLFTLQV